MAAKKKVRKGFVPFAKKGADPKAKDESKLPAWLKKKQKK